MATSDVESGMELRPLRGEPAEESQQPQQQRMYGRKGGAGREVSVKTMTDMSDEELARMWRPTWNRFDHNQDGRVPLDEFKHMLTASPFKDALPDEVLDEILERADYDRNGYIDFPEFLMMIRAEGLGHERPVFRRLIRYAAFVTTSRVDRRKVVRSYMNEYSCWPPPIFLIVMSAVQAAVFIYYAVKMSQEGKELSLVGPVPIESSLIYNPHRRYEAWRYLTYMLIHAGLTHICFNVLLQLVLGIPLEMVHRPWRIMVIYIAGVIAGSLGTSISDPEVYLCGASAGVYAVMTAHFASVIINWKEMDFAWLRLLVFLLVVGTDFGIAVYGRYVKGEKNNVGYAAHIAGGLAGLLVGIGVLRNLEKHRWEKILWWIAIAVYVVLMVAAVIWNAAFDEHFPESDLNKQVKSDSSPAQKPFFD